MQPNNIYRAPTVFGTVFYANNALEELTLESVTKDTASCTYYKRRGMELHPRSNSLPPSNLVAVRTRLVVPSPVHHGQIIWIVARAWSANLVTVLHI
jgi:hypothetical protein